MATLLERAQRHRGNGYAYGPEDYDLALALLKGEVTAGQAAAVWGFTTVGSGVYAHAFGALRAAHHEAGLRFHWEKQPADNAGIRPAEADDAQTG